MADQESEDQSPGTRLGPHAGAERDHVFGWAPNDCLEPGSEVGDDWRFTERQPQPH
jgi:hypothetical protein